MQGDETELQLVTPPGPDDEPPKYLTGYDVYSKDPVVEFPADDEPKTQKKKELPQAQPLEKAHAPVMLIGADGLDCDLASPMLKEGKLPNINKDSATVMGALILYLDFINLFLFMLRIFGNR